MGYLVGRPAVRFEWTVPVFVAVALLTWWTVARARRPSAAS